MDNDLLNQIQSVDLSTVQTAFPVLATGPVLAQVVDIDIHMRPREGKPAYAEATVKYSLAQPWKTVPIDGVPVKEIAPGFGITENIYMEPVTKKDGTVENFGLQRLALLSECIIGKAAPGARFDPEKLKGQTVTLKLKFNPAPRNKDTGEVYGPRTDVDGYVRKKLFSES